MKKSFVILGLLVFMLVVAGCKKEVVEEGPFIGGTDGVKISFMEGAPLSEFSVSESVPVKVLVNNEGEYDVPENSVEVKLYGLAMSEYGLSSDYKVVQPSLLGKKKDEREDGAEITLDMGTLKYQGDVSGSLDANLLAKVCYPYRTESRIKACATSRQISEGGGEAVCSLAGEKISSSKVSSSPVQVTSFTETLSGSDRVGFRVIIENKGMGNVYMDDSECAGLDDPAVKFDKKDKVHFRFEQEDVECATLDGQKTNEGYIRLDNGVKTLMCTMPVENTGSSYERELTLYLDFKYTDSVSKNIKILEA